LPGNSEAIPQFLRNIWAFDKVAAITEEDQQRTRLYQQNLQRTQSEATTLSLEEFLSSLNLQLDIHEMKSEEISRAAQLTQRTNQFNTTARRRSETEIEQFGRTGEYKCYLVEARDRFGDYGIVGMLVARKTPASLDVDTFLLSCRALGRRIEHQMLSFLGDLAGRWKLAQVNIFFTITARNGPALGFFESLGKEFKHPHESGHCYRLPAATASSATHAPIPKARSANPDPADLPDSPIVNGPPGLKSIARIAHELQEVDEIEEAIKAQIQQSLPKNNDYVAPGTPTEKMLAEIWSEVLRVRPVGIRDNFFNLGGHSLFGTVIISRIRATFGLELPLHVILEHPTLAELAVKIEEALVSQLTEAEMADALQELDGISDAEINTLLANETLSFRNEQMIEPPDKDGRPLL
jgi:hypothetical protein